MKLNINDELKNLSVKEIEMKIDDWRRQLLSLRLSSASSHIQDYSQFKKIRKNVARGLTALAQKCSCECEQERNV